ncbi:hypothetical protein ICC18_01575 [Paenibacillus sp. WST5]|uniref:Uncharacterized protein n=1 Tax=Paenibacillus sedimenti TaxID=2770274 RepID=A0A926KJC3_9BACL|nr:hypothetical protein [Paenibacillus sedimenti]
MRLGLFRWQLKLLMEQAFFSREPAPYLQIMPVFQPYLLTELDKMQIMP